MFVLFPKVPDINLTGVVNTAQSLKSLLSALGFSQHNPPRLYLFPSNDPLGTQVVVSQGEKDEENKAQGDTMATEGCLKGLSEACQSLVEQATRLRTVDECRAASDRLISATQTLVARRVVLHIVGTLSLHSPKEFFRGLVSIGLADIKKLVRLLRLVQAGRVDGTLGKNLAIKTGSSNTTPSIPDSLSLGISTVVSYGGEGLMRACSRDLLAAAVGGVDILQKKRSRRRHQDPQKQTDITVLSNPNFSITQSLVQTVTDSAGRPVHGRGGGGEVTQMVDALAACVLSSKLEARYRLWGLRQLMVMFAQASTQKGK